MSASDTDSDLGPLVTELVRTLRELESEFEPRTESGLPRPPSPRELMRFTSDVTIPAAILVLRTNIEALKLLQRALRMADGRSPATGSGAGEVRDRAQRLSEATLSRLDGALADLQDAVEGRPEDAEARDLLEEARELRRDVEERLDGRTNGESPARDGTDGDGADGDVVGGDAGDDTASVPVDVDAELRSIKDEFEDGGADEAAEDDETADGDPGPRGDVGDGSDADDTDDAGAAGDDEGA